MPPVKVAPVIEIAVAADVILLVPSIRMPWPEAIDGAAVEDPAGDRAEPAILMAVGALMVPALEMLPLKADTPLT